MGPARPDIVTIDSPDDPRVANYARLRERELAAEGGRFIAEGDLIVRRLLASDFEVESLLVSSNRAEEMLPLASRAGTVYVASPGVVDGIVGYKFHAGVLACGRRNRAGSMDALAEAWPASATVVILPEVTKLDNLGGLVRVASAFGADAVILGPRCCDPFYRKAIRVSMGTVFSLPLVRSADLPADLCRLRQRWSVELVATVLDEDAEDLHAARRGPRVGLLLGNEGFGLRAEEVALCDRKVCIRMKLGTDSLNVATAAGVFLYHFTSPGAWR